jgi:hypothetical protein
MIWTLTEALLPDELQQVIDGHLARAARAARHGHAAAVRRHFDRARALAAYGFETFGTIAPVPTAVGDRLERLAELLR